MTIVIIILGFLPGFVWLLFYLQEDVHPEPKKIIAATFFVGALSAAAALIAQSIFSCAFIYGFGGCVNKLAVGVNITPLLTLPFAAIEEIAKFAAVYFTVSRTKYFDEPIDAMVYMAVAALGFATVENIAALHDPGKPAILGDIFEIATFRLVGATLLHTLTSSIVGYFWALGIRNFKNKLFIFYGLFLATVLHAFFNYLILIGGNVIYPIVFVGITGFFTLGDFEKLRNKKI